MPAGARFAPSADLLATGCGLCDLRNVRSLGAGFSLQRRRVPSWQLVSRGVRAAIAITLLATTAALGFESTTFLRNHADEVEFGVFASSDDDDHGLHAPVSFARYEEISGRLPVLLLLDSEETGEDLSLALFASLASTMGRDLYVAMHDIRRTHGRSRQRLFEPRLDYAVAVIGVGAEGGHLHGMLSDLHRMRDDVRFIFVFVAAREASARGGVSPSESIGHHWLEAYAQVSSTGPELLCCDLDVLHAHCELITRRHYENADLHMFERWDDVRDPRLLRRFYDECGQSSERTWCKHDCSHVDYADYDAWIRRLVSLIHESDPDPEVLAPRTIRESLGTKAFSQASAFPAREWPLSSTSMHVVPEVWWLLQSVTCCDAQGHLIVHSQDLDDRRMTEHVRSVNENTSLPSSTHVATRSMPVRAYPMAYDLASCAHIRNWTFVTMHGLCPSAEYKSGNYAHSLLDALAPMFYTLQLLEPILGATAYEFLVVSQFADPPRRHAQRSASNCDVVAAALGFKRPAIHWDDFAMGRRRYCFDTLIMGMDMNLALAGTYQNDAAFDDHKRLRINAYAAFVRLIRVATASVISVPLASNARVPSALTVRGNARRLINEAEVLQVMARLLGGAPLVVAFERISMRQMVEEMTTIRLLVGLFSTGLTNGMFMSPGGALQRLAFLMPSLHNDRIHNATGTLAHLTLCSVPSG